MVAELRLDGLPQRQAVQDVRKLQPRLDQDLDAPGEARVDFHQLGHVVARIQDEVAVAHSVPSDALQETNAQIQDIRPVHGGIQRAGTARRGIKPRLVVHARAQDFPGRVEDDLRLVLHARVGHEFLHDAVLVSDPGLFVGGPQFLRVLRIADAPGPVAGAGLEHHGIGGDFPDHRVDARVVRIPGLGRRNSQPRGFFHRLGFVAAQIELRDVHQRYARAGFQPFPRLGQQPRGILAANHRDRIPSVLHRPLDPIDEFFRFGVGIRGNQPFGRIAREKAHADALRSRHRDRNPVPVEIRQDRQARVFVGSQQENPRLGIDRIHVKPPLRGTSPPEPRPAAGAGDLCRDPLPAAELPARAGRNWPRRSGSDRASPPRSACAG